MSDQPEALRLADRLTLSDYYEFDAALHCPLAAAELRRLHAVEADFHMAYRMKCDAETKRLRAERDSLRETVQRLRPEVHKLRADVMRLRAERDGAVADAAVEADFHMAERDALRQRLALAEAVASAASAWNVANKAEGDDWDEREALEAALKPWRVQRDIDAAKGEK